MLEQISKITSSDLFSSLCKALLSADCEDFQTIDDSGGDAGNDGYSEKGKRLFQFYCPEKPEKINDAKYKIKIGKDLDKAKKLVDSGKYQISEWVFITPGQLSEPVQTFLRTEASLRGFSGIAWASPKLTELLARHHHLRSQFPELIQEDIEKLIKDSKEQVIDAIKSEDETEKRYKNQIDRSYQRRIDASRQKLDRGLYETAKREYELILQDLAQEADSVDPHILFRANNNIGVCELNLGNHLKAADFFEIAYKAEPSSPTAITKHALAKLIQGQPEEGLIIIEKLLSTHPDDEHAIETKANILHNLGRYSELLPYLRKAGKIAALHAYKGYELMSKNDYLQAALAFEKVLKIEPKNINALLLVAQNMLVGMKDVVRENPFPPNKVPDDIRRKFDLAISCLKDAILLLKEKEEKEGLSTAYTNLSGCYLAVGLYQEAITAADQGIAINPQGAVPYLNKGVAQLKMGRHEDAIKSFKLYKDFGGTEEDIEKHIAFCSLKIGEVDPAKKVVAEKLETPTGLDLEIAELAIDLYSRELDDVKLNALLGRLEDEFPSNSQAIRLRASYLRTRGLDGAESLLKSALENAKSPSEVMLAELDLAEYLFELKDFVRAGDLYEKYQNQNIADYPTLRFAECLYNSKQYGRLLKWVDSLGGQAREHSTIQQSEAYANLYLENLDRASVLFFSLYQKSPNDLQYLVYYGMCRFRLGKVEEAKKAYDAIKNKIIEANDLAILAGAYAFIGQWALAIDLSFKALQKEPNNPKAHLAFIGLFLKREQVLDDEPIDQKYIDAYKKSLSGFQSRFPEEKALRSFEVKDGDVSEILKVVDQMAEATDNAVNLYKDSKISLAMLPKLTGKNPFDAWSSFTQLPEVGIKISFGTANELALEIEAAEKRLGQTIVCDIYPLFLLGYLNRLELLRGLFKKVYIHQSVFDELTESIDHHRISSQKGLTLLGKVAGEHRMSQIPPEAVQKTVSLLEKIRDFISQNETIEIRGLNKESTKEPYGFANVLHETTGNSVLLAQETGAPLFTDDRVLRAILEHEGGVPSFSSQALFLVANTSGKVSLEERYVLQKEMIDLNYEFIVIDANLIIFFLKKSDYDTVAIHTIISMLAKKETSTQSLGVVLANLLYLLMTDSSLSAPVRLSTFRAILAQIKPNHDITALEEGVFINLQSRVFPDKKDRLKEMVKLFFGGL